MHYRFDERIDLVIKKSVRASLRIFKERSKASHAAGTNETPPSFEEFLQVVQDKIEENKRADLERLRTPSMKEIYDNAWSQKLRNYGTQRLLRNAFDSLRRRF